MSKTISILGCGWFGLPLASRLTSAGHKVMGSTTDPARKNEIQKTGAQPFVIKLEPEQNAGNKPFFSSDIAVVNFPPRRRDDIKTHLAGQTRSLMNALADGGTGFVILISSTSVYADLGRVVTEEDFTTGEPEKASGSALREMEQTMAEGDFDLTVLRFAGLIGYDRDPRRFLKKRPAADRPDRPVNLIHRDDCVEITAQIIEKNIRGETLNAVSDSHPFRSEFYLSEAKKAGVEPPEFKKAESWKIVSGEKLKKTLNYNYKKNPL
ncbi:MAG: SDR family NAD(P)-dependent oxidoreductase [Thermodesulfobacteriota bacterium]